MNFVHWRFVGDNTVASSDKYRSIVLEVKPARNYIYFFIILKIIN